MLAYAPAVLFFVLCGIGVLRDRRRFSNAVLLGIAVSLPSLALLAELRHAPTLVAELAAVAIVALPALGTMALVRFLLANGVTMIRGEGVRPADLLSLLTGLGILVDRGFPAEHITREDRSRTTEENLLLGKAIMAGAKPDYRCVVVTNNFHAFRAALTARRTGVNGQVFGSPTAAYYWPGATIREFAAVFLSHKLVNFGICGLLAVCGILAAL